MAGGRHQTLDVNFAAAEGGARLRLASLISSVEVFQSMHHAHPAAPAAGDRLDHHRVSRALRPEELRGPAPGWSHPRSRQAPATPHRSANNRARTLSPKISRISGRGPANAICSCAQRRAKCGILAQESVARMDQVAAGLPRDRHDLFEVEIGSRADPAQLARFIRLDGMRGSPRHPRKKPPPCASPVRRRHGTRGWQFRLDWRPEGFSQSSVTNAPKLLKFRRSIPLDQAARLEDK